MWTKIQKMKLNTKKIQFSRKLQFTNKLKVDDANINDVKETKLLRTSNKIRALQSYKLANTGYQRMQLLNAAANFKSIAKLSSSWPFQLKLS